MKRRESPRRETNAPATGSLKPDLQRLVENPSALAIFTDRLHEAMATAEGVPLEGGSLIMNEFHLERGWYLKGASYHDHMHSNLQIEVVLHGEFLFQGRTENLKIAGQEAILIPPRVKHSWRALKDSLMLGIMLHPTLNNGSVLGALPTLEGFAHLQNWNQYDDLHRIISLLSRPWTRLNRLRLRLAMTGMVSDLIEAAYPERDRPVEDQIQIRSKRTVNQVAAYIHDNISKHLRLSDLESYTGMSSRNLNRLFRKEIGVSLHQYILLNRLKKAKELLESSPDRQVKEIAYECGFSSPGHLSTSMKKNLKISPQDLRK